MLIIAVWIGRNPFLDDRSLGSKKIIEAQRLRPESDLLLTAIEANYA